MTDARTGTPAYYADYEIEPVDFIHANNIGFIEGNVIKYVSRWRRKDGVDDLRKARTYIDMLIEMETKKEASERIE